MSIERIGVGPRMSQAVVHGHTIYLAGQVADKAAGKSVGEQTKEILASIDRLLAEAGSDKTHILSATIYLADIGDFRRDERDLGRLGRQGAYARARHGRGQARRARLSRRDRLHRSQTVKIERSKGDEQTCWRAA